MVISKAIPIKFWTAGNTYNQGIDSVAGVMDKIWNQKWNSTDEIVLQFYDTVLKGYHLRCYDEDEVLLDDIVFDYELLNDLYIYSKTFTFAADFGVTNQVVHLKIVDVYAEVTGEITDTMETTSGTMLFVDAPLNNNIDGDVSDTMETTSGTIVTAQVDYFGTGITTESNACPIDPTPLYWPSGVTWGTGVTMYTDAALTTPLTGMTFIQLSGEVFNINSGTGVVGSSTGIFC